MDYCLHLFYYSHNISADRSPGLNFRSHLLVTFRTLLEWTGIFIVKPGGTSLRYRHLHRNVRWFIIHANFWFSFSNCLHWYIVSGPYWLAISCLNFYDETLWFLSLSIFRLLSSSLLWFSQCFGRYVLMEITIKMKTIVRKPLMIKIFALFVQLFLKNSSFLLTVLSNTNNFQICLFENYSYTGPEQW